AYAFTIHKSQGSDYDKVLMLLPPFRPDRGVLTRETIYTGLTRAKTQAVIASDRDSFLHAVNLHIDRVSGLPKLCIVPRQAVRPQALRVRGHSHRPALFQEVVSVPPGKETASR
ncbi:MAG: ATP-binding domain-containing protein, partial [Lentisphaeria bacterium]|nr:ATP-binding domain-containing protein [Lentisphaeria bacterium]